MGMNPDNVVLIVDDDPLICDLFVDTLDAESFEVVTATTGKDARELMKERGSEFDVLVLDVHLPDEDGFELFSEARSICPNAEVIIITGEGTADKAYRAMKMGAFDFLEKPFSLLAMTQTIRNAVERKRFRNLTSDLSTTKRSLEAELTLKSFQIDQVRELVNFSRLINEHLRLDAILDLTFDRLPELVNAETFSLFLYVPESREFRLAITNRPNLDPREVITVSEDDSPVMKRALQMRQVLFIDDVDKSGLLPDEKAAQRRYRKKHSVCLPLKVEDRPVGVLNLNDFRSDEKIQEYINIAVLAAAYLAPVISNAMLYSQIEEAANRDGLTQLYNRSFFDRSLNENFKRAKRYGRPLSLLFMDIDHFKNFNDTHGHQAGDTVLKKVASRLLANMRQGIDIVARYGGEEMVLIAPETPPEGVMFVAERIRDDIEATTVIAETETEKKVLSVTVSIGTVTYEPESDAFKSERALIEAADEAMYQSKDDGRNRCTHYAAPVVEQAIEAEGKGA
jgi:diguanylate cyclase (GGDEF)-like protein